MKKFRIDIKKGTNLLERVEFKYINANVNDIIVEKCLPMLKRYHYNCIAILYEYELDYGWCFLARI